MRIKIFIVLAVFFLGSSLVYSQNKRSGSDNVSAFDSRFFGYALSGFAPLGPVKGFLNNPGSLISIANQSALSPLTGADFAANGFWYAITGNSGPQPNSLIKIDTSDGTRIFIGSLTPASGENWSSMSYDFTTGLMFAVSQSVSRSTLYTVNILTGSLSQIGFATGVSIVALSSSNGGQLYGIDAVSDKFGSINKTNGAWAPIGSSQGFDVSGVQEMDFDISTDSCYWACYNNTSGAGQLRKINISTGSSVLIGNFQSNAEVSAFTILAQIPAPPSSGFEVCRHGLNKTIPDESSVTDSITVNIGAGCTITDVNVKIDTVTHTWDSDLTFTLTKNSATVSLIGSEGGSGDNFIGTNLNDSASTPISSGSPPFTGTFIPESPLSAFNGLAPNGLWILTITDGAAADVGVLKAWCITISYSCPTGGIQSVEIPSKYNLSQNYPNPFNPATNITFSIPRPEEVSLVVYEILGKEVTTLVNEYRNAGVYKVTFDASSYPSGVYFYVLKTAGYTETKKMVLIK